MVKFMMDGGGTKKYTTWFDDYDNYIGSTRYTVWAKACGHPAKGYIQWNVSNDKDYKSYDLVCKNCESAVTSILKGYGNGDWSILKCRHEVGSSLICTKKTASTQTNHSW